MAKDKKQVLTPGGMRPESVVHHVQPGQIVKGHEAVFTSHDEPTGMRPISSLQDVPSDSMATGKNSDESPGVRPASTVQGTTSSPMAPGGGMVGAIGDEPAGMRPQSPISPATPGLKAADVSPPMDEAEQQLTPGGYRHKSLVHHIEPGHHLDLASGNIRKMHSSGREVLDFGPLRIRPGTEPLMPANVARHPSRQPALGSGWITYAY